MDLTFSRGFYEDILGFTNQTAVLLTGMGAKELLPQFRQRNISTESLMQLTVEDLQILGADPKLANQMHKELTVMSKCIGKIISTPQLRLDQLVEVLVNNNRHLSLLHAFLSYTRMTMKEESIDSFIEKSYTFRSSKAMEFAIEATICEIQDTRLAVQELKLLLEDRSPSKSSAVYLAVLGGFGLMALMILRKSIQFYM